jgi:translation elongation factor EF-G
MVVPPGEVSLLYFMLIFKDYVTDICMNCATFRYAKVAVNASEPIVPFRETVVVPPTVDMVNETIQDQSTMSKVGVLILK